jgi:hypothetical protein
MDEIKKMEQTIKDIQSEMSRKRFDGREYYTPMEIDAYMTCIGFIRRRMEECSR